MPGLERTADWRMTVAGRPVSDEVRKRLLELGVSLALDQAARFHARLSDPGCAMIDADTFPFGAAVAISLGYAGRSVDAFQGELTAWGVERTLEGTTLVIRGMDRSHRLRRGRKFRFLEAKDDGALAQKIARDHGLRAQSGTPPPGGGSPRAGQLQLGSSDHALIRTRARRLSLRQGVDAGALRLERPAYRGPAARLEPDEHLERFDLAADLAGLPTRVQVTGWDVGNNRRIQGSAAATDLAWRGEGRSTGIQQARRAFGDAVHVLTDFQPVDANEARAIARAWLQRGGERCVGGVVCVHGFPALTPGGLLKLEAPDFPLNGTWLVEAVQYLVTEGGGASTRLELARPHVA